MGNIHQNNSGMKTISKLWTYSDSNGLKCPDCKGNLILVQIEPIEDWNNPYQSYNTEIECTSCNFHMKSISFTILGSVKDYTVDRVVINGWSPSGSRVETEFEHIIDYGLLKELKQSNELVEFLIVDNHVIQVVG